MNGLKKYALLIISIAVVAGLAITIPFAPTHYTNFHVAESDDGNLTYLAVTGDYGFDKYLETGSTNLDELYGFLSDNVTCGKRINGVNPVNCSSFTIPRDEGDGYYAGRNFDFRYSEPGVVFTDPTNGYASVSTVDLRMFCDTGEELKDMVGDTRLNAAAYIPMDGLNECGVYICINAVNEGREIAQRDAGKIPIFTTSALRLVLDYASSTEQAIELISCYNLCSAYDYHLFICDNGGDSRCVEYVANKMYVTETELLTNHYLTPEGDVPATESSLKRFATIKAALETHATMTAEQVRDVMASVVQDNPDFIHYTRWSVVYDMETLEVRIYLRIDMVIQFSGGYSYNVFGR